MATWYHGTTREHARNILCVGFNRKHNYFARTIKDAQAVGGPVILAVEFDDVGEDDREEGDRWQRCVHIPIPPEHVYLVEIIGEEE